MKLCLCRVAHCLAQFCKREKASLGRDGVLSPSRSVDSDRACVWEHVWTLSKCTSGHTSRAEKHMCACATNTPMQQCVLSRFSCAYLFATPTDCNLLGSSVHGNLQARIPEWVAMSFSRASSPPKDQNHVSCLLHWQAGSLPLAPPGNHPLHAAISMCIWVCGRLPLELSW